MVVIWPTLHNSSPNHRSKKVEEKTQFKKISVQTSAVVFFIVAQRIALALTTFNYIVANKTRIIIITRREAEDVKEKTRRG